MLRSPEISKCYAVWTKAVLLIISRCVWVWQCSSVHLFWKLRQLLMVRNLWTSLPVLYISGLCFSSHKYFPSIPNKVPLFADRDAAPWLCREHGCKVAQRPPDTHATGFPDTNHAKWDPKEHANCGWCIHSSHLDSMVRGYIPEYIWPRSWLIFACRRFEGICHTWELPVSTVHTCRAAARI